MPRTNYVTLSPEHKDMIFQLMGESSKPDAYYAKAGRMSPGAFNHFKKGRTETIPLEVLYHIRAHLGDKAAFLDDYLKDYSPPHFICPKTGFEAEDLPAPDSTLSRSMPFKSPEILLSRDRHFILLPSDKKKRLTDMVGGSAHNQKYIASVCGMEYKAFSGLMQDITRGVRSEVLMRLYLFFGSSYDVSFLEPHLQGVPRPGVYVLSLDHILNPDLAA